MKTIIRENELEIETGEHLVVIKKQDVIRSDQFNTIIFTIEDFQKLVNSFEESK